MGNEKVECTALCQICGDSLERSDVEGENYMLIRHEYHCIGCAKTFILIDEDTRPSLSLERIEEVIREKLKPELKTSIGGFDVLHCNYNETAKAIKAELDKQKESDNGK